MTTHLTTVLEAGKLLQTFADEGKTKQDLILQLMEKAEHETDVQRYIQTWDIILCLACKDYLESTMWMNFKHLRFNKEASEFIYVPVDNKATYEYGSFEYWKRVKLYHLHKFGSNTFIAQQELGLCSKSVVEPEYASTEIRWKVRNRALIQIKLHPVIKPNGIEFKELREYTVMDDVGNIITVQPSKILS